MNEEREEGEVPATDDEDDSPEIEVSVRFHLQGVCWRPSLVFEKYLIKY